MPGDEIDLVDWLTKTRGDNPEIPLGIGDDMACVAARTGRLWATSDMLLDGVHFDTAKHTYAQIGRKAVACSLSDCAAKAVRPIAVLASLALSPSQTLADARDLLDGISTEAGLYGATLAGGDTNRWPNPLALDITILAAPHDGIEPIHRSGARIGDVLYVTGSLGGSILGHHLTFAPRVHEAHTLAQSLGARIHAMMDISDGLLLDLWRLCRASGVGCVLDEAALTSVISHDARRLALTDNISPLEHALSDGEDYELLLAVDVNAAQAGLGLYRIGDVSSDGMFIRRPDGRLDPLEPKGWVH